MNDTINDNVYLQKIYSSSYFICFTMRLIGESKYLYIGRGSGYEGVWCDGARVESFLRKRDKFLEYIRRHLSSTMIKSMTIDESDRIFSIDYAKWGRINKFTFFYNARNLYFANFFFDPDKGTTRLFKSWTMKTEDAKSFSFEIFDDVGRSQLDKSNLNLEISPLKSLLAKEKRSAMTGASGGKSKKFLNRKKRRILEDLNKVNTISKLKEMTEAEDLTRLPMKNKIDGVKLNFKFKDHYKRRDEVFTKIKKLNKAKKILDLRLKDTEESLSTFKNISLENNLRPIAPVWKTQKNTKTTTVSNEKNYKVISGEICQLGIGTTAQGNDQLRSEWAKKTDYWFHLDGDKSPHIIARIDGNVLTPEIINLAASALAEYSQFDYEEVNLIYTQVKNLKGVKGSAGKVIFKKEKRIRSLVNKNWLDLFSVD